MDRFERVIDLLVAMALFLLGGLLGATAYEHSWKEDCEQIGSHRTSVGVYDCWKRPDSLGIGGK